MSPDIRREVPSYKLIRRAEPDDLKAQVRALKQLQRQPGFVAARNISETGRTTSKNSWINRVIQFFKRNHERLSSLK